MTVEVEQQFILEIEWDRAGMPRLVGPFDTRAEAQEWGALNIDNGVWNIAPLSYPYLRATR
jgi:hypothetical protein